MLARIVFAFFTFITHCQCAPSKVTKRDADFWRERTKLSTSFSTIVEDPPEKYFHEAIFNSHYDGRFASQELPNSERRTHLIALLQSYLSSMNDIGVQTWIMHGTLLGWWWNRKVMPWDSDLDVQMSEASMRYLADTSNMTLWHHRGRFGRGLDKTYLLEINPNYVNGSTDDWLNVIDARWIDTETGLFIDITSVRRDEQAETWGREGALICKDRHAYDSADIFPLRETIFEGVSVNIPYAYVSLLESEYGAEALTRTDFEGHHFDSKSMEWIPWPRWIIENLQAKATSITQGQGPGKTINEKV